MTKKCIISVLLVVAWAFFASLFYKTIMLMLLFLVWKKHIFEMLPAWTQKWGMKPYWMLFFVCLWMAMPRYRIDSNDRVRLVYLDKNGDTKYPPLTQYLINTLIPEEEIVNFGIRNLMIARPVISMMGVGGTLIAQANQDIANGKIHNFFTPYDNLGMDNPMSGVYVQAFNEAFGTNDRAVYISEPRGDENVRWSKENGFRYPLIIFCHGYLGNWQLYQGIWKDLNNCIVLSIGTRSMSGIFTNHDINEIFSYYIPSLERMGYHIDHRQIHLMGLSNGGSAIVATMHSSHAKDFKSLTSISCNLGGLRKVPCRINLIGGGQDHSSRLMPSQASRLSKMGVHGGLFFDPEENHYILVNRRNEIIEFLKQEMNLTCVRE